MRNVLILASAAAAIIASPLAAQAPQQPKPVTRQEFITQLNSAFAAIDTNHDGYLSLSEIQAAQQRDLEKAQAILRARLEAEFRRLDTNHDGQLSLQEFEAMETVHANSTPQQILQQFDTNHDGRVSAAEFKAPRLQQFDKADTNHDGIVSPAEAAAAAGKK
jgi:Ca2+-binding EF-hand superfamily protein